jgi:hypothetical protein
VVAVAQVPSEVVLRLEGRLKVSFTISRMLEVTASEKGVQSSCLVVADTEGFLTFLEPHALVSKFEPDRDTSLLQRRLPSRHQLQPALLKSVSCAVFSCSSPRAAAHTPKLHI